MADKDPYVQPNGVLKNLPGFTDGHALARFEATMTRARIAQLLQEPIPGKFDLAHLNKIHRHIFQDVYAWAGKIRTVDIGKGDSQFAHHRFIESSFESMIAPQVADLRTGSLDGWARRAADCHGDLNAAHPYREGNGRSGRVFMRLLAHERGLDIGFERVTRTENVGAFMLAHAGHNGQLEALYEKIVKPLKVPQKIEDQRRAASADVYLEAETQVPKRGRSR